MRTVYSELLNLPTTLTSVATLTGKKGIWSDIELTFNTNTSPAYVGTIPIPAGSSQSRSFKSADIETLFIRTGASQSTTSDTVAISMVSQE